MCGIMGFFDANASLGPWFARAARQAAHRGPDGDGAWRPGWVRARGLDAIVDDPEEPCSTALGHLRLSILDLTSSGSQPMVVENQAAIVLNGEIYNYLELRRDLEHAGWTFASTSDTEVLLKGYLTWGQGVLERLNGMWAFAIYDARQNALLLSRDRFGEKPLFVVPWKGGIAFASEVKQLAGFPDLRVTPDLAAAARFLVTGRPYDGTSSWFDGVRQLEPGSFLWRDSSGTREGRYFDLSSALSSVKPEKSAEDWADRFEEALRNSIMLRLRSDVPVGGCLSEGLDSSAVLALVTENRQHSYHSFTLGSDDPLLDESRNAQRFASARRSEWHGILAADQEFVRLWDRMTWHQESPLASTSLYGQWKVMEAARREGVVVLQDGQGADEILGGYHKFFAASVLRRLRSNPVEGVRAGIQFLRHVASRPRLLRFGYRYSRQLWGVADPRKWIKPGLFDGESTPSLRSSGLEMKVQDIVRWSLPNLLSFEDRNAMAHSVETRLPFLDPQVVLIALAMPVEATHHGGWSKWPLRRILDRAGAPEVAWRRGKRQFAVPQDSWLDSSLRAYVEQFLSDPHPLMHAVLNGSALREFIDGWRSGDRGSGSCEFMFHVVALDRFFRTWEAPGRTGSAE